jgi:hypothetical protein
VFFKETARDKTRRQCEIFRKLGRKNDDDISGDRDGTVMLAKKGAIFQMSGMANFINKNTLKSSLLFPLGHKRREELMWKK